MLTPVATPPPVLSRAGLAPMEGITGFPMRLWSHLASRPAAMTTPFLRVSAAQPTRELPAGFAPELFELSGILPYSLTPQFMASDPEHFLRAASLLPPGIVELNCGCPSPTCVGKDAGSGILRDPLAFGRTIERLATTLGPERLAVKMRLGIAEAGEFDALLAAVSGLPLARLTVHGRTRADGYRGVARWDRIQQAAAAARAPTVASGDVLGAVSGSDLAAAAPAAAGVLVGRGALRNPWIFEELRTGRPVGLTPAALGNALLSFALLNELWMTAPAKLVARVGNGRLPPFCGTDPGAWEKLAATLAALVLGIPVALASGLPVPPLAVSPTTLGRVRLLWSHLRTSLPPAYGEPRLVRAKKLEDLLTVVLAADGAEDGLITLTHRPEWDQGFANARGGS